MSDDKKQLLALKVPSSLEMAIESAYSQYLKSTGIYITKSEFIRQKLEKMALSGQIQEPTAEEMYGESLLFIKDFVGFLSEVKNYWVRKNGGNAIHSNHETILRYFLSVIARVDDARLLSGNVYSFQTLASIERALFESAIDLTLLTRGPATNFDKIRAWDRLKLIKYAESTVDDVQEFNIDLNQPINSALKFLVDQVSDTQKTQSEKKALLANWNGKTPKTWTGENSLEKNTKDANSLKNYGFDRAHTRYKMLCLDTHGSGTAGLGTTNPTFFMGRCLFSYLNIIKWATISYYEVYSFLDKIDDVHLVKLSRIFDSHFFGKLYPELSKDILKVCK